MNKCLRYILFLLVALAAPLASDAARITVTAKLDSLHLLMGNISTLHLEVTQPRSAKGSFPLLRDVSQKGVIPVCGDSVELRSPSKIDTISEGDFYKISYSVPLQAFDSGYYRLPEFVFVAGNDSARSRQLSLKVVPVLAEANTPIHDYASTADPANPSIFDWLPDWVVDLWWLIILIILVIVAFIYGLRRYKKEGSLLPKKPEPTPYEVAVSGLERLKAAKLWEQGMEREYYTDLTEILRKYLFGRFRINALEMTSREILAAISRNKEIADKRASIRQVLDMADFVKFAKVRPLPEDNVRAFDNTLAFVKETKPVPVVEDEPKDDDCNALIANNRKSGQPESVHKSEKGGEK